MVCMQMINFFAKHRAAPLALALALAALSSPRAARAEMVVEQPKNAIVLDLGLHVVGIGYQRSFGSNVALQLDLDTYQPWTQEDNVVGNTSQGYDSDLRGVVVRFRPFFYGLFHTPYPAGGPPTGFWVSPFVQWGLAWATTTTSVNIETQTGHVFAAGVSAGWAWLLWSHLWVMLGAGGQYHMAKIPQTIAFTYVPSFARIYPQIDANLGLAF